MSTTARYDAWIIGEHELPEQLPHQLTEWMAGAPGGGEGVVIVRDNEAPNHSTVASSLYWTMSREAFDAEYEFV